MDSTLLDDIKYNCDISDARFWGYFSVCGLLMRYRDLFSSEKNLKPWSEINREDIMSWIASKESRWPELEVEDFKDLTINERKYPPFDVVGINQAIRNKGLIYGAGYGMYMKPTFFLAELRSTRELSGLTVFTSGTEYARDLFTAPGMLQEQTVFLRLEPLIKLLLYKFSELNARRNSAIEDAFARYGFRYRQLIDETFEKRLHEMAERYAEILLCHEIAESREDIPEWKDILTQAGDRKSEHYLRAVKDLIADTSGHGPYRRIIETRDFGALSLTIALTEGYRRVMFPEIREAYNTEFHGRQDWSVLDKVRREGYEGFRSKRDAVVDLYRTSSGKEDFHRKMRNLLQDT